MLLEGQLRGLTMVPWWVCWAMGFAVSLLLAPASWGAMLPVNTFVGPFGAGDQVARHWEIKDFGGIDDPRGRFLQTAAVIRCLDFLLCCDSSVSHLAGA